jgi:molybdopterin converting factor small subunit
MTNDQQESSCPSAISHWPSVIGHWPLAIGQRCQKEAHVQVTVHLFAVARQRAGRSAVVVELAEPATVADLRRALVAAVPELAPIASGLWIAVAAEYADDTHPVVAGADVAVIPPVSGGAGSSSRLLTGPRS